MTSEDAHALARVHFPQTNGVVSRSGGHIVAVWMPGNAVHVAQMTRQNAKRKHAICAENASSVIVRSSGKIVAKRRKRHVPNREIVSAIHHERALGGVSRPHNRTVLSSDADNKYLLHGENEVPYTGPL